MLRFIKKTFPQFDINLYLQLAMEKIIYLLENNNKAKQWDEILNSFKHIAKLINRTTMEPSLPPIPRLKTNMQSMLQ